MPGKWSSFDAFLSEATETPLEQRQSLVSTLLKENPNWPWVSGNKATFIYARPGARNVAINLDTIKDDPPFVPMENLAGTSLWYVTIEFQKDDLLDYMVIVNDPMTPLAEEKNIVDRVARYWQPDPYNPLRISTQQMNVSVVRMPQARPFPDWTKLQNVARGRTFEHSISSAKLNFTDRKMWVYTPPGYEDSDERYPLLILSDGQWAVGPLQIPSTADTLIKHGRLRPLVIAMIQSGSQSERIKTFVSNDRHYGFYLSELLPFLQTQYRVDANTIGVGGVGEGAIAAAHAALSNPNVFTRLIMISPPLGKGLAEEKLRQYPVRFEQADELPERIFQSVGRYEMRSRFLLPNLILRTVLMKRADTRYKFTEIGSGHGLVAFRSVYPEALAWTFPPEAESE